LPWFIKRESFLLPQEQLRPHLEAHGPWVRSLQKQGHRISSGYLVDGQGQPGGGGLLLLEASDYDSALALIQQDPMVRSGGVSWQLHQWIPVLGDLAFSDRATDT
jgi:uncharacterized protein YciI